MSRPISEFKERLQILMAERNLNQSEVAEKTGIPNATISRYLSGQQDPRADKIGIVAQTFGVDPAWLLGYDVPQKRPQIDYLMGDILIETKSYAQRAAILELAAKIARLSPIDRAIIGEIIDRFNEDDGGDQNGQKEIQKT